MKTRKEISVVRLENIKKTDRCIEAVYHPENTDECGYIKMSLDGEVIEHRLAPMEEGPHLKWYFVHARNQLERYLNGAEIIPESGKALVMWY